MTHTIFGGRMTDRSAAHAELARALEFPDYYGGNLDALWDLLTTADLDATLVEVEPMLIHLGEYGCKILSTFYEAMEENPGLTFRVSRYDPDAEDADKDPRYE